MSGRLTDSIDPLALAARGRVIEGRLGLSELDRLRPLIRNEADGVVEFSLHFSIDEGGTPGIHGVIKSRLVLECQRCMEDMEYQVDSRVCLGIVSTREAAERLTDEYDPLLLADNEITIAGIVEDELILALPIVAMHEVKKCPMGAKYLPTQEASDEDEGVAQEKLSSRKNPFAALAQLKDKLTTDGTNTDEE